MFKVNLVTYPFFAEYIVPTLFFTGGVFVKGSSLFVLVAAFAVLIPGSMAFASPVDGMAFMTEEYPPFNMAGEDGVPTGLVVDVLTGMFERTGTNLGAKDVKILPWARGYREVQSVPNTCLFSMTRTEERENLFKWVGPLFVSSFDAIVLKEKGLKASSASDLVGLRAGVVRDDMGDKLAVEAGVKSIERIASHENNLRKLDEGRVDFIVFNMGSLALLLKDMGRPASDIEKYERLWTLSESRLFFAFNKKTDDAVIDVLQKALDEMKADGTHKKILDKYELKE